MARNGENNFFFLWFSNGYNMVYDHIGGIRDPLKQDVAFEFCRGQSKVVSILTETHIIHDQIHHIGNNWFDFNFFSLGDSHTKGCLSCFIWDFKVDTDSKGSFAFFKFTPSNDRALCAYVPSGYSAREQLNRGTFFWKTKKLYGK